VGLFPADIDERDPEAREKLSFTKIHHPKSLLFAVILLDFMILV